jgi:acyl-CoA reductase-like NAD-dependent aldehyde dehydrogenase
MLDNYIAGTWTSARAAAGELDVVNPATGAVLARVLLSGQEDVDDAVSAARDALPAWRAVSTIARARLLPRRSASRWACVRRSSRSTSRRWCRSGSSRLRSPAAIRSCSSPSERVPMTQQIAFEELDALGLPPGVVNLVNGGREVVEALLDHPGIDAVSFVGSAPVARLVYERAARAGKRVQALGVPRTTSS